MNQRQHFNLSCYVMSFIMIGEGLTFWRHWYQCYLPFCKIWSQSEICDQSITIWQCHSMQDNMQTSFQKSIFPLVNLSAQVLFRWWELFYLQYYPVFRFISIGLLTIMSHFNDVSLPFPLNKWWLARSNNGSCYPLILD